MFQHYKDALSKYATLEGKATRSQFWYFVLVHALIVIALTIISQIVGDKWGILSLIYIALTIVPSIAIAVRRMHDIGKSGWWLFISFVPAIGWLWYLILLVTPSKSGTMSA